jgi:hypothetical protein
MILRTTHRRMELTTVIALCATLLPDPRVRLWFARTHSRFAAGNSRVSDGLVRLMANGISGALDSILSAVLVSTSAAGNIERLEHFCLLGVRSCRYHHARHTVALPYGCVRGYKGDTKGECVLRLWRHQTANGSRRHGCEAWKATRDCHEFASISPSAVSGVKWLSILE